MRVFECTSCKDDVVFVDGSTHEQHIADDQPHTARRVEPKTCKSCLRCQRKEAVALS